MNDVEEKVVDNPSTNEENKKDNHEDKNKIHVNKLDKSTKHTMWVRIVTAIILALIVVPAFFYGGWLFLVVVAVAMAFAIYEFVHATHVGKGFVFLYIFAYIMTYSLTFWIFMKNNMNANLNEGKSITDLSEWQFYRGFDNLAISTFGVIATLIFLFICVIIIPRFNFQLASYTFFMVLFVGLGFQSFLFLRYFPLHISDSYGAGFNSEGIKSSFLLLYVVLGTIANDIGAYFTGLLFGKHKLIPRISPNKTVEGFIGGIVFSIVISFAFAMICSALGAPILPFLSHNQWYWLLLISVLMPFFGNLGDLFFSSLKRNFALKDFGYIIRGHGGMLDRIDSLLVVALATSIIIVFIRNGWSLLV